MRFKQLAAPLALGCLLAFSAPALAKTIVVKRNGAVKTISDAFAMANDGDKIVITPGAYTDSVVSKQNNLTIIGKRAVWDGTVGPGNDQTCLEIQGDGVRVQGITFLNGFDHLVIEGDDAVVRKCRFAGAEERGVVFSGNDAVVDRCQFAGNGNSSVVFLDTSSASRGAVTRCKFDQTRGPAVYSDGVDEVTAARNTFTNLGGSAIYFNNADECTAKRNRLRNVAGRGVQIEDGDDGTIRSNRMQNLSGEGARITGGDDAVIERNTITRPDREAVRVDGSDGVEVLRNRISQTGGHAVDVRDSDGVVLELNRISDGDDDGFTVHAGSDGVMIRRNRINDMNEVGMDVTSNGATIEDNSVRNVTIDGIRLDGDDGMVRDNVVLRCGEDRASAAYEIDGDDNEITGNRAGSVFGDGFNVSGDRNRLDRNRATSCLNDGYDIESGSDNVLDHCSANECAAEGLDNSGAAKNTDVIDCTFRNSRILVGNDGTFDVFSGNNVDEADAVPCEVD